MLNHELTTAMKTVRIHMTPRKQMKIITKHSFTEGKGIVKGHVVPHLVDNSIMALAVYILLNVSDVIYLFIFKCCIIIYFIY